MKKFIQNDQTVLQFMKSVLSSSFPELWELETKPILATNRIHSSDGDLHEFKWVLLTDKIMITYSGDGNLKVEPYSSFTGIELATPGMKGFMSHQIVEVKNYSQIIFDKEPNDGVYERNNFYFSDMI